MAKLRIYLTRGCPYCVRAVQILKTLSEQAKHPLEVIDVSENRSLRLEISNSVGGWPTVPMIFVNDHFVGGCDDLIRAQGDGELDQLLTTTP